jgi:acyl dehydratase
MNRPEDIGMPVIDRAWIGRDLPVSQLALERGRLRQFAHAIGETDPVYLDPAAARAAGYSDLPMPPTFLVAAELESGAHAWLLEKLGIPLSRLLHGEQGFSYRRMAFAGDVLTVRSRVDDVYERKQGRLEFVRKTSSVVNQREEPVATLRQLIICRH